MLYTAVRRNGRTAAAAAAAVCKAPVDIQGEKTSILTGKSYGTQQLVGSAPSEQERSVTSQNRRLSYTTLLPVVGNIWLLVYS